MIKIGGYLPSGRICAKSFNATGSLIKLAQASAGTEYIIPQLIAPYDQGQISDCVTNAAVGGLQILKSLENPSNNYMLSRLFLYFDARVVINATNQDGGCFIHDALNSMKTLGICRESLWGYDATKVFVHPPIEAYAEASSNKIQDFFQITSDGQQRIADIEMAIRSNHPVVFGTSVGQNLENYNGDASTVFDAPAVSIGGHALLAVGVRINSAGKREFYIKNSWGSWGMSGYCWFSEDYIAASVTQDIFVMTRALDLFI